jgi:hypothetical protein
LFVTALELLRLAAGLTVYIYPSALSVRIWLGVTAFYEVQRGARSMAKYNAHTCSNTNRRNCNAIYVLTLWQGAWLAYGVASAAVLRPPL